MSKPRIPYFDFYPTDFMHGVRGLTAQEVGIYTMLLCRIYEENGPVEYHAARLATYCGTRESTFVKAFDRLVDLGKLEMEGGAFMNPRAHKEIASRETRLKNNSRAGKISAQKKQQKQAECSTSVQQGANHTDTDTDKKKEEAKASLSSETTSPLDLPHFDEISEAVAAYNRIASGAGWPEMRILSKQRRAALKARMSEAGGIDGWRAALNRARASPHLCGHNDRGWVANFDFLTRQSSFAKLMEGNYDDRKASHPARIGNRAAANSDALRHQLDVAGRMRRSQEAPGF